VITQDDLETLPFDLKQYRAKDYNTHFKKFDELLEYLKSNLHGAVTGDIVFSNPVKDFLNQGGIKGATWFDNEKIALAFEDGDKGFLDFLAEIEEDTNILTKNINKMIEDMNTMNDGINKVTSSLERAQKSAGSGNASYVQKEARKAAEYIGTFSKQLKSYNSIFSEQWNKVEKNTLGLLENVHATTDENIANLINLLKMLSDVKYGIISSRKNVEYFKNASLKNIGIQRTLSQSIRFLDEDLKTYLNIMDLMLSSIDKILNKSKFVVGDIDFSEHSEKGKILD
jgi:hypothetical protein